jgi:septal ring factor EnvC (AmiA/AmiB activator)
MKFLPLLVLLPFLMPIWPSVIAQSTPSSTNGSSIITMPPLTSEDVRRKELMLYILKSQANLIQNLNLSLDEVRQELLDAKRTNQEMRDEMKDIRTQLDQMNQRMMDVQSSLEEERAESKRQKRKAGIVGAITGAGIVALLIALF